MQVFVSEESLAVDATFLIYLQTSAVNLGDVQLLIQKIQYLEALKLQSEWLCARMFDCAYDWNHEEFDTGYRAIEGELLDAKIALMEADVDRTVVCVLTTLGFF